MRLVQTAAPLLSMMLAICVAAPACPARADDSTAVAVTTMTSTSAGLEALARKCLIGKHPLTLQWFGFGDLSSTAKVRIEQRRDSLSVDEQQDGQGENAGDALCITGRIVSADQESFVFSGEILTRVASISGDDECRRSGTCYFMVKGVRKYGRLQQMDNPCSRWTDDVDTYYLGV